MLNGLWLALVRLSKGDQHKFTRPREIPSWVRSVRFTRDVLQGPEFEIGEFTYGVPTVSRHPGTKLKIGKFCSIAQQVTIHLGGNHNMNRVTTYQFVGFPNDWPEADFLPIQEIYGFSKGDVVIGNDVWIGYGATILSGVHIGDGAVVGARAVVAGHVEPYSVVVGNPARSVQKRFDEGTIRSLLQIQWWDWPIDKIKANMAVILGSDVARLLAIE